MPKTEFKLRVKAKIKEATFANKQLACSYHCWRDHIYNIIYYIILYTSAVDLKAG